MKRIAFFDMKPYDKESFSAVSKKDWLEFKYFETKLNEDTVGLTKGFDGVCVFVNDEITPRVIDSLVENNVELIALRCSGYNNIDLKYAAGKIRVVRVPSYSPYAIAEHASAILLTLIRKTHKAYLRTRNFDFSLDGLKGINLHGKTIGVIGTGRIGQAFISICKGYGMKVLAYDKYPAVDLPINYVSLDRLLEESDFISLHCPLNDETRHLINESSISRMKDGVILINTSRGGLIDSEALLEGIKSGKIGGACLDVYEEEADYFYSDFSGSIMSDDVLARLISMPNVIVTSHQAFLTVEALENIASVTVDNFVTFYDGEENVNEVFAV